MYVVVCWGVVGYVCVGGVWGVVGWLGVWVDVCVSVCGYVLMLVTRAVLCRWWFCRTKEEAKVHYVWKGKRCFVFWSQQCSTGGGE